MLTTLAAVTTRAGAAGVKKAVPCGMIFSGAKFVI
jgi:hypothetical protein